MVQNSITVWKVLLYSWKCSAYYITVFSRNHHSYTGKVFPGPAEIKCTQNTFPWDILLCVKYVQFLGFRVTPPCFFL